MSTTTEEVMIDGIDDFLMMPDADSIVIAEEEEKKPGMFSAAESSTEFFEELDDETNLVDEIDEETPVTTAKPGRKKVDKSGVVEVFTKLIDEQVILPFDDGKAIEDYTINDWKDLIVENINEREKQIREQTPQEFFAALPQELQLAAQYVHNGGTDMQGLFRALSQTQEIGALDVNEPTHQEYIARQYLMATNFGNGDEALIEDQVSEWMEHGVLDKKAKQFKPKLDEMQQEILTQKLKQQEDFKKEQQLKKEQYVNNIYKTLEPAEINGIKLDRKTQQFLFEELTNAKYQSMTGKPTNKLGKLLEDYQFGATTRYDLIAEALWLLSDPDSYRETIRKNVKNEVVEETVRTLKTEQGRKAATSSTENANENGKVPARTIKRKEVNIFKR